MRFFSSAPAAECGIGSAAGIGDPALGRAGLPRRPSTGDELDRLLSSGKAAPTAGWATAKVRRE